MFLNFIGMFEISKVMDIIFISNVAYGNTSILISGFSQIYRLRCH